MTQVVDRATSQLASGTPSRGGAGAPEAPPSSQDPSERTTLLRPALAVTFAMLAVAVMTGGGFEGWEPRVFAAVAGVSGVTLASITARSKRRWTAEAISVIVIAGLGLLATLTAGIHSAEQLQEALARASSEARTLPTPLAFSGEWRFLVVVVCAAAGYGAAWLATDLQRPRLGLLLPLPLLVLGAIAQPHAVQTTDAIAAFALYAIALAILYRDTGPGSGLQLSRSFELRRTGRATVVVGLVVAGLIALDRADVLFPVPTYDPARSSQLPQAVPASETVDRVLFSVMAPTDGPWRTGVLNSYDGASWRLPPAQGGIVPVGEDAALDERMPTRLTSRFTIAQLEGPTLPTPSRAGRLSNASGPLDFDQASQTLRLTPGELPTGFTYSVLSAAVPTSAELAGAQADTGEPSDTKVPSPPLEVARLLSEAPRLGWLRAEWVRRQLMDRVVVAGMGEPVAVTPARVVDMLNGSHRVSPYELVAAEALLERWAGIPARIGFGYEGGEHRKDGAIAVHPRNASTWLELKFKGFSWFPVTGGLVRATPVLGDRSAASASQAVVPGPDIQVFLFVPVDETSPVPDYEQIRAVVLAVLLGLAVLGGTYLTWPLPYKAYRRSRRRSWARRAGYRARVAVAYAELRDAAIDLGDDHEGEAPLHFLSRVSPDLEHTELAWLVTRVLWGDLGAGEDEALAAEALSRSVRSRLRRGQPGALRVVAAFSKRSLRHQYWPELGGGEASEAA